MRKYLIRSTERSQDWQPEPLFWNNERGWVSFAQATIFTEEERMTMNLPMGACKWVGTV